MDRTAAVLALAVLVAAGCGATPGATPAGSPADSAATAGSPPATPSPTPGPATSSPAPAGIEWRPCTGGAECGSLLVPLDPARPDGEQIRLVLLRYAAADPANRIGSLVLGVGGPGDAGTSDLRLGWDMPMFSEQIRRQFDVVAFDARGMGLSSPVTCLDPRPELAAAYPVTAADDAAFRGYASSIARACQANNGDLLPYMSTDRVVADLEAIRRGLGDERLTFLGWSYGTVLGAMYADRYPDRVRAMVLDAAVDPAVDLDGLLVQTARGYQRALDAFLADCRARADCAFAGGSDPTSAYRELVARFAGGDLDGVTQRAALDAITATLSAGDADALASALDEVRRGEAHLLGQIAGARPERTFLDAMDAVICVDLPGPRSLEELEAEADRLEEISDDFGRYVAYRHLVCTAWPVAAQRTPAPVRAAGAPPILVLTSTGDPAATREMSEAVANQLESGVLVVRDGPGHTNVPWNRCMAAIAEDYLLTISIPAPGAACSGPLSPP